MADGILSSMGLSAESIAGTASATIWIIEVILVVILFSGIIWALWWLSRYKHTVLIRDLTGNTMRVTKDKARIWKDKNGVMWLKLMKHRHKDRVPPAEAFAVNKRGNYHFDIYYSQEDDGYVFASQMSDEIKHKINNEKLVERQAHDVQGNALWDEYEIPMLDKKGNPILDKDNNPITKKERKPRMELKLISSMMPFSTSQRSLYVQQQKETLMWKTSGLWEFIDKYAAVIMIMMFLIIFTVLFGMILEEVMPHVVSTGAAAQARADLELQQLQILERIVRHINATGVAPG